jgi:cytoskeleton protein RodZ
MERVGEKLRRRREELGFTIDDIARATKYRPDVIKAVEEGRTSVFPAEAYRQAFLRAYADKLGLDPAEVVREQKSEEERVREALKGMRLKPRASLGVRRTLVWLFVVVGVVAAVLILYDRVIKVRMLGEPVIEVESPGIVGAESTDVDTSDYRVGGAPSDSTRIDEEGETENAAAMEAPAGGEEPRGAAVSADQVEETAAHGEGPVAATGRDWLAVSVRGYAVRVRLRAGDSILVDSWLEPDFSDTFYSFQPFWADTIIADGNAIKLVLNGEAVALPSASGSVITDFRISP